MKTPIIISLIVLSLVLWFKAISDISRTKFKSDSNNRAWFLIVFLIPVFGAIIYFMMKKKYIISKPKFDSRF
jgi:hypothetical protein